jgi:hypothetical protein
MSLKNSAVRGDTVGVLGGTTIASLNTLPKSVSIVTLVIAAMI